MISISSVERHLFLEGIFLQYGYDFRQYAEASLTRRLSNLMIKNNETSLLNLLRKVIESPEYFRQVLPALTVNTTEFFRDPEFFRTLRAKVFPILKTYPTLNIWVAGCSTGEEVYSLAMALKEEGLLNRATIYATDINTEVLKKARDGIYEMNSFQQFAKNYVLSGGTRSPSEYFTADYGLVRMDSSLRENVVFMEHNLTTDSVFAEHHLILCRNVLIYFSKELQDKVFDLLVRSMNFRGFLGIGSKESVRHSSSANFLESVQEHTNIFQQRVKWTDLGARQ